MDASEVGLPQPSPRFDPSGTPCISSFEYPIFLLMSSGFDVPQQLDEQQDFPCLATRAYPSLTIIFSSWSFMFPPFQLK
jgi:hypothetical protein